MKRLYTLAIAALLSTAATMAQTYTHVWQNGDPTNDANAEMTFSQGGSHINVGGIDYLTSAIDSITFGEYLRKERVIAVNYSGNTATVDIPNLYQDSIQATIDGANVKLVNKKTGGEEFVITLTGSSNNGSFLYDGEYKCTIVLNGISLTSTSATTAPLDIKCGKRVELHLAEGTTNSIEDCATGDQKAALWCKGHLEISGAGKLNITANAKHGIATKEYLLVKRTAGTIRFLKAASDAIHAGQYFQMNGGTILIDENTMGDGIQVEAITLEDGETIDPTEENNGQIIIKGGTIQATIAHEDCKGLKCDKDITISGGKIDITAQGNGSRGIQTGGNMTIAQDDATIPTTIDIKAQGARCTLDECVADPHRCMGMKIDGNLTVTGGTTTVVNTGSKSRGIKLGGLYNKTGGVLTATISQ